MTLFTTRFSLTTPAAKSGAGEPPCHLPPIIEIFVISAPVFFCTSWKAMSRPVRCASIALSGVQAIDAMKLYASA